jgi:ParB-like chromosome segregation protein Spo0J
MQFTVSKIDISHIKENPRNPRFIRDAQYEKLKQSLNEDAWMQELREIIVDENSMILCGNMRYRALKDNGVKDVSVKQVFGLTDKQKQALTIKDNKELGEWDFDMLASDFELQDLADWGFEAEDIGIYFEDKKDTEQKQAKKKETTCPACGHEFIA